MHSSQHAACHRVIWTPAATYQPIPLLRNDTQNVKAAPAPPSKQSPTRPRSARVLSPSLCAGWRTLPTKHTTLSTHARDCFACHVVTHAPFPHFAYTHAAQSTRRMLQTAPHSRPQSDQRAGQSTPHPYRHTSHGQQRWRHACPARTALPDTFARRTRVRHFLLLSRMTSATSHSSMPGLVPCSRVARPSVDRGAKPTGACTSCPSQKRNGMLPPVCGTAACAAAVDIPARSIHCLGVCCAVTARGRRLPSVQSPRVPAHCCPVTSRACAVVACCSAPGCTVSVRPCGTPLLHEVA